MMRLWIHSLNGVNDDDGNIFFSRSQKATSPKIPLFLQFQHYHQWYVIYIDTLGRLFEWSRLAQIQGDIICVHIVMFCCVYVCGCGDHWFIVCLFVCWWMLCVCWFVCEFANCQRQPLNGDHSLLLVLLGFIALPSPLLLAFPLSWNASSLLLQCSSSPWCSLRKGNSHLSLFPIETKVHLSHLLLGWTRCSCFFW